MEEPTREQIEQWIAGMESLCMDINECAMIWCSRIDDENTQRALYDIRIAARNLGYLCGHLAPPASE